MDRKFGSDCLQALPLTAAVTFVGNQSHVRAARFGFVWLPGNGGCESPTRSAQNAGHAYFQVSRSQNTNNKKIYHRVNIELHKISKTSDEPSPSQLIHRSQNIQKTFTKLLVCKILY
jgi:hypothetical protein